MPDHFIDHNLRIDREVRGSRRSPVPSFELKETDPIRLSTHALFGAERPRRRFGQFAGIYHVLGASGLIAMSLLLTVALLSIWGTSAQHHLEIASSVASREHPALTSATSRPTTAPTLAARSQPAVDPSGGLDEQARAAAQARGRSALPLEGPAVPAARSLISSEPRISDVAPATLDLPSDLLVCINSRGLDRQLSPAEIWAILKLGRELTRQKNLAEARLSFQKAAEACEPEGALLLAQSYDLTALQRLGIPLKAADAGLARSWYELAKSLGSAEAADRLDRLPLP